ncbi:MAG: DUF502 domain-containing protein [Candidatus Omnitrophica bacterium]|nr:DUF502 domain-containing protein [Candidatus Omnitrophota bacterium]
MASERKTPAYYLRRYLVSGFATILPLFITIYVIVLIFRISNRFAGRYINDLLMQNYGFTIPGLGLIFLLMIVLGVGAFVSNFIGHRIYAKIESIFYRAPLVARIYPSAKKLSDFLFKEKEREKFRKVVLVEYPAPGSYSIGFLTNEGIKEFNEKAEEQLVTVLVPLSPMPYSGLLLALPRKKIRELDMTINDAIKLVFSGGVVVPSGDDRR